jgi:hypothetical protein
MSFDSPWLFLRTSNRGEGHLLRGQKGKQEKAVSHTAWHLLPLEVRSALTGATVIMRAKGPSYFGSYPQGAGRCPYP